MNESIEQLAEQIVWEKTEEWMSSSYVGEHVHQSVLEKLILEAIHQSQAPLLARIEELEKENANLRGHLDKLTSPHGILTKDYIAAGKFLNQPREGK